MFGEAHCLQREAYNLGAVLWKIRNSDVGQKEPSSSSSSSFLSLSTVFCQFDAENLFTGKMKLHQELAPPTIARRPVSETRWPFVSSRDAIFTCATH